MVINETLAGRLWPDGDGLDHAIILEPEGRRVQVIGIARDSKYRTLSEASRSHFYLPAAAAFGRSVVRTKADPRHTLASLQRALDHIGPGLVGFFPRTLDDHLAVDMLPTTTAARVALALGILALLLSGAGLYGMVMWFVVIRQREIGVRRALGASGLAVRRLVVGRADGLATAPGLVVGVAMAIAIAFLGRSLFVGVGVVDPIALCLGIGAIVAVVLIASYLPSRRATRVDPLIVLRDS